MIKTETVTMYEHEFLHTYSDAGRMIRQDETGALYEEAYDPADHPRTYTETDEPIPAADDDATAEDYEAALAALGVQ